MESPWDALLVMNHVSLHDATRCSIRRNDSCKPQKENKKSYYFVPLKPLFPKESLNLFRGIDGAHHLGQDRSKAGDIPYGSPEVCPCQSTIDKRSKSVILPC
jgi:hypothetical protein